MKSKGFLLIELIVSVAVLSVGILMVLQALAFSARITGLFSDSITAVFLSEDKLQDLEFKERRGLIANEPKEGNYTKGKFDWEYKLDLDPDLELYKLNFVINWQRKNRKEQLQLNTYLR